MKRCALLATAVLALGGCGSDDEDEKSADTGAETTESAPPESGTKTFDSGAIGFTFAYPDEFTAVKAPDGQVLGQVALDEGEQLNAVKVRKTAEQELGTERYLDEFQKDFAETVGKVEKREEKIGGLEMGVLEFEDSIEIDGEATGFSSTSYFFAGGGKTWQIECIADADSGEQVDEACTTALESIEFK